MEHAQGRRTQIQHSNKLNAYILVICGWVRIQEHAPKRHDML